MVSKIFATKPGHKRFWGGCPVPKGYTGETYRCPCGKLWVYEYDPERRHATNGVLVEGMGEENSEPEAVSSSVGYGSRAGLVWMTGSLVNQPALVISPTVEEWLDDFRAIIREREG